MNTKLLSVGEGLLVSGGSRDGWKPDVAKITRNVALSLCPTLNLQPGETINIWKVYGQDIVQVTDKNGNVRDEFCEHWT